MSTKKETDIIPSESYYKHCGALMSPEIAAEFLYERFACINDIDTIIRKSDVAVELDEYQTKGGGLPHDYGASYCLRKGIRILERNGCATRKSNVWKIHERVMKKRLSVKGKIRYTFTTFGRREIYTLHGRTRVLSFILVILEQPSVVRKQECQKKQKISMNHLFWHLR